MINTRDIERVPAIAVLMNGSVGGETALIALASLTMLRTIDEALADHAKARERSRAVLDQQDANRAALAALDGVSATQWIAKAEKLVDGGQLSISDAKFLLCVIESRVSSLVRSKGDQQLRAVA